MTIKPKLLPDKSKINIQCPACDENFSPDRGIGTGHSYLEVVEDECHVCPNCDGTIEVTNPFIYGFVEN